MVRDRPMVSSAKMMLMNSSFEKKKCPRTAKITLSEDLKNRFLILSIPEDKVTELINSFNSYNQHIKFTVELEKNRKLPFLDLLL
jgi:hypothetical protein